MKILLPPFILCLIFVSFLEAGTIHVPGEQLTIQSAIDTAVNGDIVLVHPGTYFENINFNGKNIVIGSLFLTTGEESYISQTIIDGNDLATVVTFENGEDTTAVLYGLSITNGHGYDQENGGGITCRNNSNPRIKYCNIYGNTTYSHGGGVLCTSSWPALSYVTIYNNYSDWGGGGLYSQESSRPYLKNVTITGNSARYWGGAIHTNDGSSAKLVNSIVWNNLPHEIRLLRGSITVRYCDIKGGEEEIVITNSGGIDWREGNIESNPLFCNPYNNSFTLAENSPCLGSGLNNSNMGAHDLGCDSLIIDSNTSAIYVSVTGSDELGNGSYDNPYCTIQHAIDMANSGDSILVFTGRYTENIHYNKQDIFLSSFFYLTNNPFEIDNTIIDGDSSGSVVYINNGDTTSVLNGFTITNGNGDFGGGIRCNNSEPTLSNLKITGNRANNGGGIYASNSDLKIKKTVIANNYGVLMGGGIDIASSHPIIENVTIRENIAEGTGGGCLFSSAVPYFKNTTITANNAYYNGGGIALNFSAAIFDSVERCNIYLNHAGRGSDIDFFNFDYGNANLTLYADTFTVLNPTDYHVYRIDKFDILNGKIEQSDSNLYVNPAGSDNNNGESAAEPLKTISYALAKIISDSNNPHTIYLSDGHYTPSKTGEHFPLNMVDYISLEGTGENVKLNAEGLSGVLSFYSDEGNSLKYLTIKGGYKFQGGGIYCENSSPEFYKVAITDNTSMTSGGGMYCFDDCYPYLERCTISHNHAEYGGGISLFRSCISTINTIVWGNYPDEIYFHGDHNAESCAEISYSDIRDSLEGINTNNNGDVSWLEGNINANPLYCNPEEGYYTLAENSPCLGRGLDGQDIGAFTMGCGFMELEDEPEIYSFNFSLHDNFPNPFNPITTISYELPNSAHVKITIYDINGRLVETLVNETKNAGSHSADWDASKFSSGIYFYRIETGDFKATRKCVLLK